MKTTLSLFAASVFLTACAQWKGSINMDAFNVEELRQAERALEIALSSSDPSAWVEHYTEDAVFVAPNTPAVQGRDALTKMSKTMRPLSSVKLTDLKTDGFGKLAAVYGRGTWVNGAGSATATTTNVRLIIVWRKEEDGRWRIAQELLHPEPASK
jgi:uncharacterized protein (TIGR02246 family)